MRSIVFDWLAKDVDLTDGKPFVCFDLETTGLSKNNDKILSFSAIKAHFSDDNVVEDDRINLFINPEVEIPEYITEINHISNETVKDAPLEEEAAAIIYDFMKDEHTIMTYSNFDEPFLNAFMSRVSGKTLEFDDFVDVLALAKVKLGKKTIANHKLSTVAHYYKADEGLEFHNSIDDVIATIRVYENLLKVS